MRVFLESGKDVMDPKTVKDVCKDNACVEYLVKMLESEDRLSKAAMITTRTALAPEVGYHQMLIDCGIIKTLTDIMNQKLLLRKPSRMKKNKDTDCTSSENSRTCDTPDRSPRVQQREDERCAWPCCSSAQRNSFLSSTW